MLSCVSISDYACAVFMINNVLVQHTHQMTMEVRAVMDDKILDTISVQYFPSGQNAISEYILSVSAQGDCGFPQE